jgi:hypothetical protein
MHCDVGEDVVHIRLGLKKATDSSIELWGAERRKELFEEIFTRRIEFVIEEPV